MALHDQRVFRSEGRWWIASVEVSSGVGRGGPRRESVFFTCLSDDERESLVARIEGGYLNRLSHQAMQALLSVAESAGSRLETDPHNMPDVEEYRGHQKITDDEGLTWVVIAVTGIQRRDGQLVKAPAAKCVCLDDSALQREVGLDRDETLRDLISMHGGEGLKALIETVKSLYEDKIDGIHIGDDDVQLFDQV